MVQIGSHDPALRVALRPHVVLHLLAPSLSPFDAPAGRQPRPNGNTIRLRLRTFRSCRRSFSSPAEPSIWQLLLVSIYELEFQKPNLL